MMGSFAMAVVAAAAAAAVGASAVPAPPAPAAPVLGYVPPLPPVATAAAARSVAARLPVFRYPLAPINWLMLVGIFPVIAALHAALSPLREGGRRVSREELFARFTARRRGGGRRLLLAVRAGGFLALALTWVHARYSPHAPRMPFPFPLFAFFTIWTTALTTAYFGFAAGLSLCRCLRSRSAVPRLCARAMAIFWPLFQLVITSNMVVCLGFWTATAHYMRAGTAAPAAAVPAAERLAVAAAYFRSPECYAMHLVNGALVVLEFALTALPVELHSIDMALGFPAAYFVLCSALYGCLPSAPADLSAPASASVPLSFVVMVLGFHAAFVVASRRRRAEVGAAYLPDAPAVGEKKLPVNPPGDYAPASPVVTPLAMTELETGLPGSSPEAGDDGTWKSAGASARRRQGRAVPAALKTPDRALRRTSAALRRGM